MSDDKPIRRIAIVGTGVTSNCNMLAVVCSPVMRGEHVRGPSSSSVRNTKLESERARYTYSCN
jgi:hypothetical protein